MKSGRPLTPAEFQSLTGVSRETLGRLEAYLDLLGRWQRAVNLVGTRTLDDPWRRHILDSAQLFPLVPREASLVDLGSGAGLPGLVLAILGVRRVGLVEADGRKAEFLREAARVTGSELAIHVGRAELLPPVPADFVCARALAPLKRLLGWAARWLAAGGMCLFPKGRDADGEIVEAGRSWHFAVERLPSRTEPDGVILRIGDLRHV
ncbi:MAG: 16S rRNA (guanine(527)-N(7))-methyltransferase RsmG [Alphaproteobacteria bacterium]|nr:16S rRNA (guanine(527)-N(7))-methyltransferase RsmG [Alphaproteobacteria bacterium]